MSAQAAKAFASSKSSISQMVVKPTQLRVTLQIASRFSEAVLTSEPCESTAPSDSLKPKASATVPVAYPIVAVAPVDVVVTVNALRFESKETVAPVSLAVNFVATSLNDVASEKSTAVAVCSDPSIVIVSVPFVIFFKVGKDSISKGEPRNQAGTATSM